MSYLRFSALEDIRKRKAIDVKLPSVKTSEYFAVNVFDLKKMQEYLSEEAYESVKNAVESGSKIDRKVAEQIASGQTRCDYQYAVATAKTRYFPAVF